jgi:hypothetical protein
LLKRSEFTRGAQRSSSPRIAMREMATGSPANRVSEIQQAEGRSLDRVPRLRHVNAIRGELEARSEGVAGGEARRCHEEGAAI